uniref:Uncharacterized protein n=1 Tax=Fibrocapsa japonica TaxID=94617 RepID=A0A7S2XVH2_9STRA|mmetsp:Transcript_13085/g.19320  ORF Transcript_13085/g.19320 Transcript_13085/m.19320 type:complete len:270 (-) Transcript_13085:55-864(-)
MDSRNCCKRVCFYNSNCQEVWQNPDLVRLISEYVGWKQMRVISKKIACEADSTVKALKFRPQSPEVSITGIAIKCNRIQSLVLDFVESVQDQTVKDVIYLCKNLRFLGVSYCALRSWDSISSKPSHLHINIHGCWRLLTPHKTISPMSVVELQMIALKNCLNERTEAFEKACSFTSPEYRDSFMYNMSSECSYQRILGCESFVIREFCESVRNFACLVAIRCIDKRTVYQLWVMAKQRYGPYAGCWMTDGIYNLARGLPLRERNGIHEH